MLASLRSLARLGSCASHLGANLLDLLRRERLGSFQRQPKRSAPDQLGHAPERTRDTEQDGVVVLLRKAERGQELARVGVHVGPRVLGFTGLEEDVGHDVVDLFDEFEHGIVGRVFEAEFTLGRVSGVGLAQDGVSESGPDAGLQVVPDVFLDFFVCGVFTDGISHLVDGTEDFLVGQAVQGAGETVQGGTVRQEGVREGGTDQVRGVGRDVSTLVVRVNGHVETHQLDESGVISVTEHVGQVPRVILGRVDGGNLAVSVDVLEDSTGDGGQLGDQVHGILIDGLPVVLLGRTLGISLGERGIMVERGDGEGELRHGVQRIRASVNQVFHKLGQFPAGGPFGGQALDLFRGGDFTGDEEPEEGFGQGFGSTGCGGELGLAFGDGQASESDTLVCERASERAGSVWVGEYRGDTYRHRERKPPRSYP